MKGGLRPTLKLKMEDMDNMERKFHHVMKLIQELETRFENSYCCDECGKLILEED